ncbi:DUF2961 domain-containing protein [Candidatus Sumerlaeota bacterium]|nr:DUF2961 domain-containing protein [Candidatus Sumerlaeota bacterium]
MKQVNQYRHSVIAIILGLFLSGYVFAESLETLPQYKDYSALRESSFDRSGGNADNVPINPGETRIIADIEGPGCITHIWCTMGYPGGTALRKLVIRAWFDGAETPCIEAPLGDFFGLGHALVYSYSALPLSVGSGGGMNCWWNMPFNKSAKITITNEGRLRCSSFFYYVDYRKYDKPKPNLACFHAQYRQAMPCKKGEPYVIMEAVGRGHFVGCHLSIEQNAEGWWGEGDDKFYIDSETTPTLWGTGSEDYFSGAWCYKEEFAYPYIGMPLRARISNDGNIVHSKPYMNEGEAKEWRWPLAWRKGDLWNVYRYHIEDPVPFKEYLRVEIEHGFINNEREDNYSSVAYWYQGEPHGAQPAIAPVEERIPFFRKPQEREPGLWEGEDFAEEAEATGGEFHDAHISFFGEDLSRSALLEWKPPESGDELTLPFTLSEEGEYEFVVKTYQTRAGGRFEVFMDKEPLGEKLDLYEPGIFPWVKENKMGVLKLSSGNHKIAFRCIGKNEKSEGKRLALDALQFLKVQKEKEVLSNE